MSKCVCIYIRTYVFKTFIEMIQKSNCCSYELLGFKSYLFIEFLALLHFLVVIKESI